MSYIPPKVTDSSPIFYPVLLFYSYSWLEHVGKTLTLLGLQIAADAAAEEVF